MKNPDSPGIIMRRKGNRLIPVDMLNEETLSAIPAGVDVIVKIVVATNTAHLRWMWALAHLVAQSRDDIHDKEQGMDVLCEGVGHMDRFVSPLTGHLNQMRRTLRLPEDQQIRLKKRMMHFTITEILPGVTDQALTLEIEKMVAPRIAP